MSLRSLMRHHLERRMDSDDIAEDATFLPKGHDTGFPLRVAMGDPAPTLIATTSSVDGRRRAQSTLLLAVVESGTETITGHARGPLNGDRVVLEQGVYAGRWVVDSCIPDSGGGLSVDLVFERTHAVAHEGARKVSP